MRKKLRLIVFVLLTTSFASCPAKVQAGNEAITIPIVLADYYVWAYTQAFRDRAFPYAWSTAGVDALGWGTILFTGKYSGLFLVNVAGLSKTVYPLVRLADGDVPMDIRRRAWRAVGTHAGTLLLLKALGKPAISVQSWTPAGGGEGVRLALGF
jgi:hypothetical protein